MAGVFALMTLPGWVSTLIIVIISFLSRVVLPWLEYGMAYDGIPYVAGAFPIAAVVAAVGGLMANLPRPPGVAEEARHSPSGPGPNPVLDSS